MHGSRLPRQVLVHECIEIKQTEPRIVGDDSGLARRHRSSELQFIAHDTRQLKMTVWVQPHPTVARGKPRQIHRAHPTYVRKRERPHKNARAQPSHRTKHPTHFWTLNSTTPDSDPTWIDHPAWPRRLRSETTCGYAKPTYKSSVG